MPDSRPDTPAPQIPVAEATPPPTMNRRTLAAVVAVVVVLAIVALGLATRNRTDDATTLAEDIVTTSATVSLDGTTRALPLVSTEVTAAPVTETVPPPADGVATPPNTHTLPAPPYRVAEALPNGPLAVFDRPGATVAIKTLPNPVLYNDNPNARLPLVMLIRGDAPPGWIEVFLPIRPNGSTGFVRAGDVRVTPHDYRIEVHLSAFNLKVFKGNSVVLDTSIAVATDNTPTPGGLYYTNMLLKPPDPNTAYGTYAYGLSGFSDTLTSFNGGPGQLGLHGTNDPTKIGQKVSHGCIRMRNEDIEKLVPILPLGVPVLISR